MRDKFNFLDDDKDWFNTGIIGLKIDVPIFNSGAKFFKVQQSRIELKQARNNQRKAEQGLKLQFSQAKSEFKSAFDIYKNTKNNMKLSKEVFDKTLEKYKEGIYKCFNIISLRKGRRSWISNY